MTDAERAELSVALKQAQALLSLLWWEVVQPEPNARIVYGVSMQLEEAIAPVADWAFVGVLKLNALRGKPQGGSDDKTNTPPDPVAP